MLGTEVADDPVEVVLEHRVRPEDQAAFLRAAAELRTSRLRTGAVAWDLLSDPVDTDRSVERYGMASWADHRDQHERCLTPFDADGVHRAAAPAQDPPQVARLLVPRSPPPARTEDAPEHPGHQGSCPSGQGGRDVDSSPWQGRGFKVWS